MEKTNRQRYVTCNAHESHSIGEECWASRKDVRTIVLEFDNGDVIELKDHYLNGLETPFCSFEEQALILAGERAIEEIYKVEDKKCFEAIDSAIK